MVIPVALSKIPPATYQPQISPRYEYAILISIQMANNLPTKYTSICLPPLHIFGPALYKFSSLTKSVCANHVIGFSVRKSPHHCNKEPRPSVQSLSHINLMDWQITVIIRCTPYCKCHFSKTLLYHFFFHYCIYIANVL